MSITNTASAQWKGGLKTGKGVVSTASNALDNVAYDFKQRFEGQAGTNPEELIGAAHASCFSMALSMILGEANLEAESIETEAQVSLDQVDDGFAVTRIHLITRVSIPDADDAVFQEAAAKAKAGCPISKLLNAEISLDASLV